MADLSRLAATIGAGCLVAAVAGCGGSTSPAAAPSLPVTSATVQSAVDLFSTGTVSLPPICGSIGINCPGGTAGSATQVTLTRSGLTITQAAPDSFAYAMDLGIVTQTPFTVSNSGVDCAVAVNTAGGSSPAVHIAGTAVFGSQTLGGPIDRVDLTTTLTGAEAADITVTGPVGCQALATSLVFFEGAMASALTNQRTHLCAGSGGHLVACS